MIVDKPMIAVACDTCGIEDQDDEWEATCLWDASQRQWVEEVRIFDLCDQGWSTDGEGVVHCPDCPRLELTEAAKAARARKAEATGPDLFELLGKEDS